MSYKFVCENQF